MRPTRIASACRRVPEGPDPHRLVHLVARLVGLAMAIAALMGLPVSGATALAPTDAGPPSTPLERVQALVQPAVVYEKVTWTAWAYDATNQGYFTDKPFTVSFQCTGFVVNPSGYIATAGHCVEYSDAVAAALARQVAQWAYENQYYQARPPLDTILTFAKNWRLVGKSKTGEPDLGVEVAYGVSVSGEETGKALQARVVGSRPKAEGDVALLKIDAKNLTVLPLSSNENVGVGTQVVSVGYPMSVDLVTDQTFDPSFKEGSISAEKTTKGGLYPVYEISSAVSGGMSGGPTTSLSGQAIGVNSFGIAGETQQFNFVQSSKTLEELMRSEGVPNELGQVTDLYRSGLNAYFAGDREASILAFDGVIEIVPTHEFAQKYRTKAKELPEQKKILGMPILTAALVVAAVLVVVVVVVAVVLILLSKRRKSATQPTVQPPFPPTLPGGGNEPPGGAPPNPPESPPPPPEGIPPAQAAPPPEPTEVPPGTGEPVAPPQEPIPADEGQPAPPAAEAGAKHFCPNCGSPHAQGARFCENCGGPL